MKQGILIASYGSSHPFSIETSIGQIEGKLRKTFEKNQKNVAIYHAFTSPIVIHRLKETYDYTVPTVEEALAAIKKEGVTHLLIIPTHFLPGTSYTSLYTQVDRFASSFEKLHLDAPLLSNPNHYEAIVTTLTALFHRSDSCNATIFLAHGSNHAGNTYYKNLEEKFHQLGHSHYFILTLSDLANFDQVCKQLNLMTYQHIHIAPLLFGGGYHSLRDLCGKDEGSLASLLLSRGFHITCHPKGLGEYQEFQDLFLQLITKNPSCRF